MYTAITLATIDITNEVKSIEYAPPSMRKVSSTENIIAYFNMYGNNTIPSLIKSGKVI